MPPTSEQPAAARVLKPVIGPRLRGLLAVAFTLFGLLAVNGFYLASVTVLEELSGDLYQDFFYQIMFLLHLVLGLFIVVPGVVFGALHLRNAWPRPNYRAVRAGLALYITVLLMLISGLALTRFDFFSLKDPLVRSAAYWLHVATPLLAIWLFILHRLAGKGIRYGRGIVWGAAAVLLTATVLLPSVAQRHESARAFPDTGRRLSTRRPVDDGRLLPAMPRGRAREMAGQRASFQFLQQPRLSVLGHANARDGPGTRWQHPCLPAVRRLPRPGAAVQRRLRRPAVRRNRRSAGPCGHYLHSLSCDHPHQQSARQCRLHHRSARTLSVHIQ
jgi:hypothetical protein